MRQAVVLDERGVTVTTRVLVKCQGEKHEIVLDEGRLSFPAHADLTQLAGAANALAAIDHPMSDYGCCRVFAAWASRDQKREKEIPKGLRDAFMQRTCLRSMADEHRERWPSLSRERSSPILDLIGVWPDGRLHFPTICKCAWCEGVTACSTGPGNKQPGWVEGALAVEVALVQHGYYMAQWADHNVVNVYDVPHACTCKCKHEWASEPIAHCLHRWTCRKCGLVRTVDSSD